MRVRGDKKQKVNWQGAEVFSIECARDGGLGLFALVLLREAGIPAQRASSPFQGHVGIRVPKRYVARAEKLVL